VPASYAVSKIAAAKLMEYIASENKDKGVRAYALHPGVIETEMSLKSLEMAPADFKVDWDDVDVAAHFCVWLSSQEGKGTVPGGRFLWGNWDVEELKERRGEVWGDEGILTVGLVGWPSGEPEEVVR
jgi:NAD(P)-dependent dehydrogenase (short-subunit alcohol dehydrogenase family)